MSLDRRLSDTTWDRAHYWSERIGYFGELESRLGAELQGLIDAWHEYLLATDLHALTLVWSARPEPDPAAQEPGSAA